MPTTEPQQPSWSTPDEVVDLSPEAAGMVRSVLERLPDIAHVYDSRWRWIYLNPAARAWIREQGLDPSALPGRSVWDVFPDQVGTPTYDAALRAVAEQRETVIDAVRDGPAGRRHYETRAFPMPGGGLVSLTRDVTDPAQALDSLRESTARLELSATLADLGVWSVDLRTRTSSHDARLRAMFALDDADDDRPPAALWMARIHPDELPSARRRFLDLVSGAGGERTFRAEHRIVWPDGTIRWLSVAARLLVDDDGTPARVVGVAQDITRWRKVREERQRWADAFQHTSQGVVISDARTDSIVDANPAFGRILGYTPDELRGMPLARLYAPAALHELGSAVRAIHEHGRLAFETTYARHDGSSMPVFVDATVVTDADGSPLYRIASIRELSYEKRLRDRQLLLVQAGGLLASSLDYATTIQQVVELAVPTFADWAVFNVPDHEAGRLHTSALWHRDPSRRRAGHEIDRRFPMHMRDDAGAGRVLRTGEPELVSEIPDELLAIVAHDAEHLALLRQLGFRSLINVPLVARGETLGVLGFGISESSHRYDDGDLRFAQELAHRAALAIDNARLYAAERSARERTERLQRVTAALTEALTPAQVADVIIREAMPAVGAQAGSVCAYDEESGELALLAQAGLPEPLAEALRRFRPAPGSAAARLLGGTESALAGPAAWGASYAGEVAAAAAAATGAAEASETTGLASFVAFPLIREGRAHGIVGLDFVGQRVLTADELDFMHAVIAQGSQAVERARLFETAERERRRAERSAELARRIQEVTAALSVAVTPGQVARTLVRHGGAAVGASGGALAVLVEEAMELEIVFMSGIDGADVSPHRRFPCVPGRPISDAIIQHRLVTVQSPEDAQRQYPGQVDVFQRLGARAFVVVPVLAGERVIAALGLRFDWPRAITAESRDYLATLGEVAGQALERARLYAAESDARAEAERARGEAEAANAAKSDFLAVMSHELRTPLNAIAGYTQLLELGVRGPVTAGQLEDLGRIQRSQRHLLGLINDVLNFATLDAGRVEYRMESVPVAELLLHATEIIAPQTDARGISFHAASANGLVVHADREKVQQVLLNLLANAARFTPPGGRIEVDTDHDRRMVRLHVRDTGPGIPPDQWERVFEPFVQLGRSRSSPGEGSGLGLAISRDLARGMGGDLTVTSVPGGGACFTLHLEGATDAAG